jgi:AAA+ superfamily predicted ATPase
MNTTTITRGQKIAADVSALLRARNALLWVVTSEEARVEALLFEAAASAGYATSTWDVAAGITYGINDDKSDDTAADPSEALKRIVAGGDRRMWIMRDLPAWLSPPAGTVVLRQLRNLARSLPARPRDKAQAIVVLSPSADVPQELQGHATVIEWPLPDRDEIAGILDAAIAGLPEDLQIKAAPNGAREAAIDAAVGLNGEEAASCYARSLVQTKRIDPMIVAGEKKRVIAKEQVLTWYDPIPGGLDAVGGLENLKAWLTTRKSAYTREAREYGLPTPKGVMLVGVPGCGKSLTAKAIATAWGIPLLRVDLGALKSKFVGESEGNLRKAFEVIEAIGRCVVWFDEIEKALQGATSGSSDGGVSSDALGAILSWMQERQGAAFVVATANDVEGLPPELLRKGRFDELFFVDAPNRAEREAVLLAAIRASNAKSFDVINAAVIATRTDGFTGAEIAALVPDAMFAAFNDGGRAVTTQDLKTAAATVVPLTTTAKEKIDRLRKWAAERARNASAPAAEAEATATRKSARTLDIA